VVVAATRGYQVEVSVGETDVARVAVGNPVVVTPDGGGQPVEGTVAAVGLLPDASSGGSVTYEVTIALPGATGPYPAGQGAAVAIRLADVTGVLTVPTSAVRTTGADSTVEVLRGDVVGPVPVQVGAVGPQRTEIVSGLAPGDRVVVADPSRPLPTPNLFGPSG
jgi:multidrug efflux pump subunit AcrA (membrane-fusion protein)